MGRPAEGRWWVDRSGQVAAALVLAGAVAAWAVMLSRPMMTMPGMGVHRSGMSGDPMGMDAPVWTIGAAAAFVAAWALMMAAMMLPSATPMFALFSTVSRSREPQHASLRTAGFVLPYAALWSLTGIPVYAASVWFAQLNDAHPGVHHAVPYLVATVLVGAGGYQFSRLKRACLTTCQNALGFLVHHWRPGAAGAVLMGAQHAGYCLGCCALLMVVLVAAGSMGLAWVLLVAVAVFAEKVAPPRAPTTTVTAVLLLGLGLAVLIHPTLAYEIRNH